MGVNITNDIGDESKSANLQRTYPCDGVYFGTISHRRMIPPTNQFTYKTAMAFLEIQGSSLSSTAQNTLANWPKKLTIFHSSDYLPMSDLPLEETVRQMVSDRLGFYPTGKIFLLSHLKTLGWNFNPISIYYIFSPSTENASHLEAIVMEVTNTPWNQRHCYVMPVGSERLPKYTFDKQLHVSPYLPMDVTYEVIASHPEDKLSLHFRLYRNKAKIFDADLLLRFEQLNKNSIRKMLITTPLPPLKTSFSIYWQALLLKARGARWYRHPEKIVTAEDPEDEQKKNRT